MFTVVQSKHCLPLQSIQYAKYNLPQETKEAQNASLIDKSSLKEKNLTYQEAKNTGKY